MLPSPNATHIAARTFIKGELRFEGPAVIAGRIEGRIVSADTLEIAPEGIINGDIRGSAVAVHGTVNGNIHATQSCRIGPSACVAGEISAAGLAIAEGARFIGQVCIGESDSEAASVSFVPENPQAQPAPTIREVAPVLQTVTATIHRLETRIAEPLPVSTTMTMPVTPEMPAMLTQTVPPNLQRVSRIIKAR